MFYKVCIKIITPIAMAFIFAGSISGFFTQIEIGRLDAEIIGYIIAGVILVVFWFVARSGRKNLDFYRRGMSKTTCRRAVFRIESWYT